MKKKFIVFGILLGGAMGILSSALEVLIWIWEGRPDFLIRRGWESTQIVFMVGCGLFAGCLYGMILSQIIKVGHLRPNAPLVFLFSLLVGIVTYTPATFMSIRFHNLLPSLTAHVIVFVMSLVITHLLWKHSRVK